MGTIQHDEEASTLVRLGQQPCLPRRFSPPRVSLAVDWNRVTVRKSALNAEHTRDVEQHRKQTCHVRHKSALKRKKTLETDRP